jgi:hypothetical protein
LSSLGINVRRDGSDDPNIIRDLNAQWIRIVATPEHDLRPYFQRCRDRGLKILLVLARESGGDYALYRDRYASLVDAVQVGNEFEGEGPSSWIMSGLEFVSLGRAVRGIFPRPFPIVAGGLVSGQPSKLDGLDLSWADRLAVHPYGKSPSQTWPHPGWGTGYMGDLLDAYRPYALGQPLIISEIGLGTHEVSEEFQAEYLRRSLEFLNERDDVDVAMWFCLQDFPE